MYKGNKILCVIPARGGSKGLPGKNIKNILGRPLIVYTIEQAQKSKYIDRIIVSTDNKKIAKIAGAYGAETPFLRPKRLATDQSSSIDVLLHAMDWMENKEKFIFDILVLLHVTTPLRSVSDIDRSIELLFKKNADNVFSVTPANRNPYFNMVEIDKKRRVKLIKRSNFTTRQSAPCVFDMNASIYVWKKDVLRKKKRVFLNKSLIYVMPKDRSIDIDDHIDFKIVEALMRARRKL